ncbi:MAG TPA: hypothetical protein VKG25_20805 [Bryobacteraceae bacterium]|nr:hypothetical protein [Bryobacteraceae bacterium]
MSPPTLPDLIASVALQQIRTRLTARRLAEDARESMGGKNFDALIFGYYEGDRLIHAARTRNGFTPASREQLQSDSGARF